MPKIFAFRTEPWTAFAKDKDSIFEQDFVKDKVLTFKTTLKPSKGIVKFKQMIQYQKGNLTRSQEIKVWFPFKKQGSSLYTLIGKNQAKIRYDHGFRSYGDNLFDFYGGVESEKNFKNIIMKLGANVLFVNSNFDSRVRVAFTDAGTNQVSLGHKFNWSQGKWSVDLCKVFNLGSVSLFKNSLRVIYRHNSDNQVFFKAENHNIRNFSSLDLTSLDTYYTDFTLDYIRKIDDLTVAGLQVHIIQQRHVFHAKISQVQASLPKELLMTGIARLKSDYHQINQYLYQYNLILEIMVDGFLDGKFQIQEKRITQDSVCLLILTYDYLSYHFRTQSCYIYIVQQFQNQLEDLNKRQEMGNFINVVNVIGWSSILALIGYKFINNPYLFFNEDLTLEVGLIGLVQAFQILDILLILFGKSKGSLIGSIAQITGRMVVAWLFLQSETNRKHTALMAICWSIADITRYCYYLIKVDGMVILRYNLFIILYPIGVYAEMRVINDYIRRHAATLTIDEISYIRMIQGAIILGTVFLYLHMLKMRAKHMRKVEPNSRQETQKTKAH